MKQGIIFEVIPSTKSASASYTNKVLDRIADVLDEVRNVSILNVPEIVEENHVGMPYYRNVDNREFGIMLRERCIKDIMVNTVVVHHTKEKLGQWLDESMAKYKINNFVFVGQKINSIMYPGPTIIEANTIAKSMKINFGNIFIPERQDEAKRMLSKTASGCSFFTSQILFEPENAVNVIHEYGKECIESKLKPAKFFLSFSPVSSSEDIAFIKWLGAEINEKTEKRLNHAQDMGNESIKIAAEALRKISDSLNGFKVPLGLNIEYISLHNLELSKNLINAINDSKLL